MTNHEVISAFLDHEPFDPRALTAALAKESGRELLIDLVALRTLTQPDEAMVHAAQPARRVSTVVRWTLAAAAVLVALAGGYRLGERSHETSAAPPAPTEVVTSDAWQPVPTGGSR